MTGTIDTATIRNQVANANSQFNTISESQTSTQQLADNYSTFLTMLTTQLQNQDPLSPMDSNQFTQQLVQFSAVEQQISANTKLDQLVNLQQLNGATTVLGYIGKEIEAIGNQVALVNDTAKFAYELNSPSEHTIISIMNSNGQVIRTVDGPTNLGKHAYEWDGKDSGGIAQPKGNYKISVQGVDAAGNLSPANTYTIGKVTAIETTADGALLSINGLLVNGKDVLAIRDPNVGA